MTEQCIRPFLLTKSKNFISPDGLKLTRHYGYEADLDKNHSSLWDAAYNTTRVMDKEMLSDILREFNGKLYTRRTQEYLKAEKAYLQQYPLKPSLKKTGKDEWKSSNGYTVQHDMANRKCGLIDPSGKKIAEFYSIYTLNDRFFIVSHDEYKRSHLGIKFSPEHFHVGDTVQMKNDVLSLLDKRKYFTVGSVDHFGTISTREMHDVGSDSIFFKRPYQFNMCFVHCIVKRGSDIPALKDHENDIDIHYSDIRKEEKKQCHYLEEALTYMGFFKHLFDMEKTVARLKAMGLIQPVGEYKYRIKFDTVRKMILKYPHWFFYSKSIIESMNRIRDSAPDTKFTL